MKGLRHSKWAKNGILMFCIAVFLFSYANATMFWHGHYIHGHLVLHSHISSAEHRSTPEDNPHDLAGLQLIQTVDSSPCTDEIIPSFDLEEVLTIVEPLLPEPEHLYAIRSYDYISRRGPPELA